MVLCRPAQCLESPWNYGLYGLLTGTSWNCPALSVPYRTWPYRMVPYLRILPLSHLFWSFFLLLSLLFLSFLFPSSSSFLFSPPLPNVYDSLLVTMSSSILSSPSRFPSITGVTGNTWYFLNFPSPQLLSQFASRKKKFPSPSSEQKKRNPITVETGQLLALYSPEREFFRLLRGGLESLIFFSPFFLLFFCPSIPFLFPSTVAWGTGVGTCVHPSRSELAILAAESYSRLSSRLVLAAILQWPWLRFVQWSPVQAG